VRINCAHDGPDRWERMIGHARAAEKATGRHFKILMDLAGPKIRTGEVRLPGERERIGKGALLAIVPAGGLGRNRGRARAFCDRVYAVRGAERGEAGRSYLR